MSANWLTVWTPDLAEIGGDVDPSMPDDASAFHMPEHEASEEFGALWAEQNPHDIVMLVSDDPA